MKHMRSIVFVLVLSASFMAPALLPSASASAESSLAEQRICEGAGGIYNAGAGTCISGDASTTVEGTFKAVINTLLFVIAAIAVIMIIISGIKFVLSGGDNSAVTSARNTVLYSVIGLVVAFAAYAIVNFVVLRL